jgi:transcriptional regulator with XRE-family HTH domain
MLGEVIRRYRLALGMKQRTLAERIGMPGGQSYISAIEKGTQENITTDLLLRIAGVLNIPHDELIEPRTMPSELLALQSAGVPDKDLQELARMWPDLSLEQRQATLLITRSMWESAVKARLARDTEDIPTLNS